MLMVNSCNQKLGDGERIQNDGSGLNVLKFGEFNERCIETMSNMHNSANTRTAANSRWSVYIEKHMFGNPDRITLELGLRDKMVSKLLPTIKSLKTEACLLSPLPFHLPTERKFKFLDAENLPSRRGGGEVDRNKGNLKEKKITEYISVHYKMRSTFVGALRSCGKYYLKEDNFFSKLFLEYKHFANKIGARNRKNFGERWNLVSVSSMVLRDSATKPVITFAKEIASLIFLVGEILRGVCLIRRNLEYFVAITR